MVKFYEYIHNSYFILNEKSLLFCVPYFGIVKIIKTNDKQIKTKTISKTNVPKTKGWKQNIYNTQQTNENKSKSVINQSH